MQERIWTISNILSLLRIFLVIPIVFLLLSDRLVDMYYAIIVMIVAALTDSLDGMLARKFQNVTEFGKIIDPLADKVAITIVMFVVVQQEKIPLWFFLAAAVRDVLIFLGGVYVKQLKGIVLESNVVGKWTVTIIAIFVLIAVINLPELQFVKQGLLVLSTVMLVISFGVYFKRFVQVIKPLQ